MKTNQFAQEFNSLSHYLKAFAVKLTKDKNNADDLYQETALKAFKYRDKYQPNSNMKAWLSTLMKNSFINQFRKHKQRQRILDSIEGDFVYTGSVTSTHNEGVANLGLEEISKSVNKLSHALRVPFLMAYEGYSYNEICDTLDLPLGTVKSRIHLARKSLQSKIVREYATAS